MHNCGTVGNYLNANIYINKENFAVETNAYYIQFLNLYG